MSDQIEETKEEVNDELVVYDISKFMNADEYSPEELQTLARLYDQSFQDLKEGEIIKGKIVGITDDNVVLDIGFKSDGTISRNDFTPTEEVKLGMEVDVVIERTEDEDGNLVLSKKRADFLRVWAQIIDAHDNETILSGKILKRIKGGMVVDIMGIESFLPGSQIDIRPVRDFDAFVGQIMDFKIVKINNATENVVVSHKALIEETISDQRKEILEGLDKGQILEGIVKAITDFGVFVDLGGVDGLVHITDLSWGRINHPSEIVKLDEKIKVVVTDFDIERKRISLSLKQLQTHPWEKIDENYKIGDKVAGRVVSLTDYGAFIEIEKGIEGLIHISEMSWTQHINHPSQHVSMGQTIDAIILSLDKNDKKISLGIKQLTPDPWQELLKKYPVGSRHTGTARNLTNFGVFVELEPGIDGLVHISDLSWTKKVRHPGEVVKKGEKLDIIVLGIDTDDRKISLGHKQVTSNPWDNFESEYGIGKEEEVTVVRIIEKGVIAELSLGVDGFIPGSQLSSTRVKNLSVSFPIGCKLPAKIVEFDKENKKIVLSVLATMKDKTDAEIEDYISKHTLEKVSVEDIRNADSGKFDSSAFSGDTGKSDVEASKKEETKEVKKEEPKADETVEAKTETKEVKKEEPKADETVEAKTETVDAKTETEEVKKEEPKADEVKKDSEETKESEENK